MSKVIKKVVKSKIFKVIAIAVLIYVGGAALGAWKAGGSLAKVNGVLRAGGAAGKAGAAASGAGSAASTTAATTAGSTALAPGAGVLAPGAGGGVLAAPTAGQAIATSVIPAGVGTGTGAVAGAVAPTAATLGGGAGVMLPGGTGAASETGAVVAKKGIISKMMDGVSQTGHWMNDNPLPTAMALRGVGAAMTPDQMEIDRQRQDLTVEEDERQRRIRNENLRMNGFEPPKQTYQPLKFISTGESVFNTGVMRRANGAV